jgi:DNA polymerase-3 subunit delta'
MTKAVWLPLPWQAASWQRLQQLRLRGQLPHALLLGGPPGIGKRRLAQAFGAGLLCEQSVEGVACGDCKPCHLLAAGAHPDWQRLVPEESGKAIKIDQVRGVVEFVTQTSLLGGWRVVVVEPAEAMNRNAANALLKTLEEPPASAILLLVSDAPGQLLPTIRSRCQQLLLMLPTEADSLAWLAPLAGDAEQAAEALREAGGRPLAARALLDGGGLAQRQRLASELADLLSGRVSVPVLAERWQQSGWEELLAWLQGQVWWALRERASGGADTVLAQLPAERLFGLLDRVNSVIAQSRAGTNPNRQLALEALLFAIQSASRRPLTPAVG